MKNTLFAASVLALSSLSLAACSGGEADAPAEAAADETGLVIKDATMMLPAVAGNPAAIYFTVENGGDRNVAIRKAAVEGAARAELHETAEWDGEMVMGEMQPLMLQPGDSATFEPGGKHVMVFELDPSLAAGGTTTMTLTIAGGKSATADVAIKGAGDER